MKLKVYIDTSVIGGSSDDEFSKYSKILIEKFKNSFFIPVISEIIEDEIKNAPPDIKDLYNEILTYNAISLNFTDRVKSLVNEYLNKKIVTLQYIDDCRHIAFTTS